ncbi:MAG: hypothetical protein RLZ14_1102, partial [Actinomycetota bacterium]
VGAKMLLHHWYPIPTWLSLMVIAIVLMASMGFSVRQRPAIDTIEVAEEPPPPQER